MRKLIIPILFTLVFLNFNTGHALANSAKLSIPVSSHDFGEIPEGQAVEHVFILNNIGKTPLEIKSITPDCNCAKVRLSANRIKPGKQAEIIVTFDSQGQGGSFTKLVIIETNDPIEPIKMIKIKGTVIKEDA